MVVGIEGGITNIDEIRRLLVELGQRIEKFEKGFFIKKITIPADGSFSVVPTLYIGVGTTQGIYQGGTGEVRVFNTLIGDGDIIAVGTTSNALRIYSKNVNLALSGASDGAYDTTLYASAADTLATPGDLKFFTNSKGVILKDRVTGTFYRLKVSSGVLGIEAV
jgi:hypothetical protein